MMGLDPRTCRRPAVRRAAAGDDRRSRDRGALRALDAVGRRPAVSPRPGRGQLLRRGGVPAPARGRAPRRGQVRRRMPGLLQRAGRGRARGPSRRRRTTRGGRRGSRGTSARAGTSRTFAITTCGCCSRSIRWRCARSIPSRYLELSRQVTGEVMGEVFGEWRRAESRVLRWARAVAERPRRGRRMGSARPSRGAQAGLPPRAPGARAGRGLDASTRASAASSYISPTIGAEAVEATLRVAMYRDMEVQVEEVQKQVVLEPRQRPVRERGGVARPVRRRLLGVPVRPAGAGSDRGDA